MPRKDNNVSHRDNDNWSERKNSIAVSNIMLIKCNEKINKYNEIYDVNSAVIFTRMCCLRYGANEKKMLPHSRERMIEHEHTFGAHKPA